MHVSTFYFCKMFRKTTGLTFTDYLGRVRVEKAKNLLLNLIFVSVRLRTPSVSSL
jgi:YesN/AraC family two-component response regulator